MYCGIELEMYDREVAGRLLHDSILSPLFTVVRNAYTNEDMPMPYRANDRHMVIKVSGDKIVINGSLHQFYYWGNSHTNFSYSDVCHAIVQLIDRYHLAPEACRIVNLEFGINFAPKIPTREMIDCLRGYHNKLLSEPVGKSKKQYQAKSVQLDRYIVKYYNKALLCGFPQLNIMRFEYKTRRMADLNKVGIATLADLADHDKFILLGKKLSDSARKVTLFDESIITDLLEDNDKRRLLECGGDPYYWKNWHLSRPTRSMHKRKYHNAIAEMANRNILGNMLDAIDYKITFLAHT